MGETLNGYDRIMISLASIGIFVAVIGISVLVYRIIFG